MTQGIWRTETDAVERGIRHRFLAGDEPVTFRELFERLESDDECCDWYTALLAGAEAEAFFWEHPPLDDLRIARPAELVLIEAPALAGNRPDPRAFSRHFAAAGDAVIAVFPNLGGDALLLAPCPRHGSPGAAHLAAFLRAAPVAHARALWRSAAQALGRVLGREPVWLSTSGLGVPWPHLRLDRTPKYYQHAPYRTPR